MFNDLIRVQDHDTAADQLRHRRETLPELVELGQVKEELGALVAPLEARTATRDEVARRQRRLEDELTAIEAKIAEIESRLYSGAVTVPRDLQAMEAERTSLRRRQSGLEDGVLEAMTEREPIDEEIGGLEARRVRLEADAERLAIAATAAQAEIDVELANELDARAAAAAELPDELNRLYEQLRARNDGVGAARLVNGRCGGCHLALAATELDQLRRLPPDAMVRCEQCGRLLVR